MGSSKYLVGFLRDAKGELASFTTHTVIDNSVIHNLSHNNSLEERRGDGRELLVLPDGIEGVAEHMTGQSTCRSTSRFLLWLSHMSVLTWHTCLQYATYVQY